MSYTADIADAVVEVINTGGILPSSIEAERVYVPTRDYSDFSGADVCKVFAPAIERQRESRAKVRKDIELAIVYASKLNNDVDPTSADGNAAIDPLMAIGESIADYVAFHGPYATAPCLRVDADPIYDFEILRSHRVFVTRLRAFFYKS